MINRHDVTIGDSEKKKINISISQMNLKTTTSSVITNTSPSAIMNDNIVGAITTNDTSVVRERNRYH